MNAIDKEILDALKVGLHHSYRAHDWTQNAKRRATEEGMYGTASTHEMAAEDTVAAIKFIESVIDRITKQQGEEQ